MFSPVLEDAWIAAQPRFKQIRSTLSNGKVIRVAQLDAELLDQELVQLLLEPIRSGLSLINLSLRAHFEPEIALFIKCILYKSSVWNTGASYGATLQNLKYAVSDTHLNRPIRSGLPRNTLLAHSCLTLIVPYLHDRIRSYALSCAWPDAPSSDYRKKAWDALNGAETLHGMLGLFNFVAFLCEGRYRTLSDRLLQMKLVRTRRSARVDVSYEFMNRQMVWYAFTEFLLFLLPLFSRRAIRRLKSQLKSIMSERLTWTASLVRKVLHMPTPRNAEAVVTKQGRFATLLETQCAICIENAATLAIPARVLQTLIPSNEQADPAWPTDELSYPIINPYETTCGHIYCYQCIAERIIHTMDGAESNMGWECLRCGNFVKEAHRYVMESQEGEVNGSEYEFSSDLDVSTNFSGSTYTFSETGLSE